MANKNVILLLISIYKVFLIPGYNSGEDLIPDMADLKPVYPWQTNSRLRNKKLLI